MGFLATLRGRLADVVTHRPAVCMDPVLGELEEVGAGLWRTRGPVILVEGMEPISITVETEVPGEVGAGEAARTAFVELQRRYLEMRGEIGKLLCGVSPRVRAEHLWEHAALESVEIWREPRTGRMVLALEYVLSEQPEYTYTVRVEEWRAVDVVISG